MKLKEVEYPTLNETQDGKTVLPANMNLLKHVEVSVEVRLGSATMRIADLFALQSGSVLKLDRLVDEPIEILLNGQPIAVGQLAVLGEHLGVRITAITSAADAASA